MILSRILARRRIAAGVRPSFIAAWVPVAVDTALIGAVLAIIWGPLTTFIYVMDISLFLTVVVLMLLIYAPLQTVIILSTIAAVRSRWKEEDPK